MDLQKIWEFTVTNPKTNGLEERQRDPGVRGVRGGVNTHCERLERRAGRGGNSSWFGGREP